MKRKLPYLIVISLLFLGETNPVYAKENMNISNHTVSQTNNNQLKDSSTNEVETLSTIFPDAAFATYIASILHISVDDDVTQQQLDTIKSISASNAGISDLTGISRLSNLTSVSLTNNSISTIDDLKGLTKLTSIILNNNQITTIDGLENLVALTKLEVMNNQLKSISLSNLTNLQFAEFQGNPLLGELSCVNLPKIPNLYSGNYVSSTPGVIVNSTNLEALTIKNIPNVSELIFSGLSLQSVDLNDLPRLTQLDIRNNQLAQMNLGNISNLTSLYITDNKFNDEEVASYIQANSKISTLSMGNNDLSQIDYLQSLNNLAILRISSTNISDLSPLQGKNMTELYIDNTPINNVDILQTMTNLTRVEAFNTQVTDITGLVNLDKLTTLLLQNNAHLKSVNLDGLDSLTRIELENNEALTDLTLKRLAKASRLYDFSAANSDITIGNTPSLQKVTLDGLPSLGGDVSITHRDQLTSVVIKDTPIIARIYLNNNNLSTFPDISGVGTSVSLINVQSNHIFSIDETDFALDLINNNNLFIDLESQTINGNPTKNINNVAIFENQISAWGTLVVPQAISNNGYYSNEQVIWNNLSDSIQSTNYTFSSNERQADAADINFTGTVTVPIISALPAPIITADEEITYAKTSQVTESKFLADIHASTSDGSTITSNFATAVNWEQAGDYEVTLNSINADGISAVPFQVTVHVEKSAAPIITADEEITYAKTSQVTESKFLADIHASTSDGSTITSNFATAVNWEQAGDYEVTLNAINADGISAVPFQVTVHVEKSAAPIITADTEITYAKASQVTESKFLADIHASTSDGSTITSNFATAVNWEQTGDYEVTLNAINADGVSAVPFQVTVHVGKNQENRIDNNTNSSGGSWIIESGSSTITTINLPKTGDETNAFPTILGVLCIGGAALLGFRRTQIK
ncbi:LapB repeat-containing protein [Listeria monocytogenes]|nr:LPXTG cell wall anchor domain-containing protein [Listeria monocytogenes]EIP2458437.1 LapB repeat-containing protein [Listeria monocytogenes]EIP2514794.1 LapB repeat-containing protein [Listeria monocytogenes]EIR6790407.1 LapB repeat-containing protein [Listeria monocytogenes]